MPMPHRRAVLALAGAALMAVAGSPLAAEPASAPLIAAIHVSGTRTVTLRALAPRVAGTIAEILGPRYQPGARGGATLVVDLTEVVLDDFDGGANTLSLPFGHGGGADALTGNVALIGPRREALAEFPMLATSGAIFRSTLRAFPDPRRLDMLARAFAWWTVGRIS